VLRIRYAPIGAETLTAITTENIDVGGADCVLSAQADVSEIMKILDSAAPVAPGEHRFTDKTVRVKIFEKVDDAGEHLMAIVENTGVVRRGAVDQVLSPGALGDLKTLIEEAFQSRP